MTAANSLDKLDSVALKAFVAGDLSDFIKAIDAIRAIGQEPPSLYDITSFTHPLAIGQMDADDDTAGTAVAANVKASAQAIDQVFNKHKKAFDDLKLELTTVIAAMLKTQGTSLATIEGQKFLTAIGTYDSVMSGGTGTGAGSGSGSGSGASGL